MKITEPIIKEAQEKMTKAEDSLRRELGNIRAGRANASLLNRINVEYYGAPTPLIKWHRFQFLKHVYCWSHHMISPL